MLLRSVSWSLPLFRQGVVGVKRLAFFAPKENLLPLFIFIFIFIGECENTSTKTRPTGFQTGLKDWAKFKFIEIRFEGVKKRMGEEKNGYRLTNRLKMW